MRNTILHGDCLELMKDIPDGSIDMILCDLPYGTTRNKWDSVIDLDLLWKQYKRLIKKNGAIVLTAQTPFDKVLGCSNIDMLKYEWIWEKPNGTGFLNANFSPLKSHENILVFSKSSAAFVRSKEKAMVYNPQKIQGEPYKAKQGGIGENYDFKNSSEVVTVNDGNRFPKTVLRFKRDPEKIHPTQKPVALFEYLIKTYTNPGALVLDNCAGSGTTGEACINTGRDYILMEKELKYIEIIKDRIELL